MLYEVLLGIDRAARDTGKRVTMRVRESDPLSAGLKAEEMADRSLPDPDVEYTHAMTVRPVSRPLTAAAMAVPLAA